MKATYRIGTDIGGTFTDLVLLGSDGTFLTKKVLSTPPDYERGVLQGIAALLRENKINPSTVERVAHATTVATNAVLERRGAKSGLITTRGFRDILELRRLRFPDMYNLFWEKPKPLVDRYLRLEVTERIAADGEIITPLDMSDVSAAIDRLAGEGITALSVCLLNSYANPRHEEAIGEFVRRKYPDLPVSLSCRVLPEIREFERTSTTVINSYLMPVMQRYLAALEHGLRQADIHAPLFVMQSNGGAMTAAEARNYPVHILESGPAAGVTGAVHLATSLGIANAVTFDMGGTTAKAAMIEDGEPSLSSEYQVGAPISIASRVLKGGGYALRAPTIDIAEVGAGGGSIVAIDQGGALRVGPRSAGASPGPACYGNGGVEPSVTDANLLLG
jgi:N-methylhydantoinase A/oxoprolinase/acetone carboxylase beta subunit